MGDALIRHRTKYIPYYTFATTSASGQLLNQDVQQNPYPSSSTNTGGYKALNIDDYMMGRTGGNIDNIFAVSALNNVSVSTSKTTADPYYDGTKYYYSTIRSYSGRSATMSYSNSTVTVRSYAQSETSEHMLNRVGDQKFATMGFNCVLVPDTSKLIYIGTSSSNSSISVSNYTGLFNSVDDFIFKFSNVAYSNIAGDSGSADKGVTYGSGASVSFSKSLSNNSLICNLYYSGSQLHNSGSSGYIPLEIYLIPKAYYVKQSI